MVAIPISPTSSTQLQKISPRQPVSAQKNDWSHLVAAGTVLAGGALMVAGRKKAGMAVAAAGTALALLEDQETVQGWWNRLPEFLGQAQVFLDKAEVYLKQATVQGQRIQGILRRNS